MQARIRLAEVTTSRYKGSTLPIRVFAPSLALNFHCTSSPSSFFIVHPLRHCKPSLATSNLPEKSFATTHSSDTSDHWVGFHHLVRRLIQGSLCLSASDHLHRVLTSFVNLSLLFCCHLKDCLMGVSYFLYGDKVLFSQCKRFLFYFPIFDIVLYYIVIYCILLYATGPTSSSLLSWPFSLHVYLT